MFTILYWVLFGLFVGLIAKALHPGDDPVGFVPTIGIGIAGSFIGGGINWLIGAGPAFGTSGMLMSIIGGVIFCYAYSRYKLGEYLKAQKLKNEEEE